ncbi:MAG: porin, partial [Gemmatimonadota bacterium]
LGDDATFSMDAFVVNGLMGEDGSGIRGFRGNDREKQSDGARDDNKAVGGRLGFVLPNQHLDFGGSVYTGNSSDLSTQDLTLTFFGVDAHYFYEGLSIRAEFITADQEATGGDLRKKGGYLQAAYQANRNWEPVVRFSIRDMPGESSDQNRFSLGLNYIISPAGTVRLNYHINTEETGFESENNTLVAQFVTGF